MKIEIVDGHFRDLQEAWLIYMPCGKRCAEIIVS